MKLKHEYFEDIKLFRNTSNLFWSVLLLILLFTLPFLIKPYYLSVLNLMMLNVIVALGLNLLVGNTGQISLGHAGFVAIGAYSGAFLMQSSIPFLPAIIAAGLITALIGGFLGIPSLRLEGPYLSIVTLGFGLAVMVIIGRIDFFGGRTGMSVPRINLDWTGMKYDIGIYYVFVIVTVLLVVAMIILLKSRFGRAFQAIRDSDIAASVIGINVARYKTLSFAISAFYAGVAGCLWGLYLQFVTPGTFSFMMSIMFLATIVLGGLGSVTGSVMGAIVMTFLTLQLENVVDIPLIGTLIYSFSDSFMNPSGIANIRWVLTGLILIGVILFEPMGLNGLWLRVKRYWRLWPF